MRAVATTRPLAFSNRESFSGRKARPRWSPIRTWNPAETPARKVPCSVVKVTICVVPRYSAPNYGAAQGARIRELNLFRPNAEFALAEAFAESRNGDHVFAKHDCRGALLEPAAKTEKVHRRRA